VVVGTVGRGFVLLGVGLVLGVVLDDDVGAAGAAVVVVVSELPPPLA
jgi:hypothetical protein